MLENAGEDQMLGNTRWLVERVNALEKTLDRHIQECAQLARQNLERSEEILRQANDNAAACIKTANDVRDAMQRSLLKAAIATITILVTVMGGLQHMHL